jgi:crotonobetainyl-CoA:carnitine CoA-transferase CaiB-like acyl-CoA transferase
LFGREEFRDPKYASTNLRVKNVIEVRAVLEECLANRDAKDVFLDGAARRLLLGVVQDAEDLLNCEHLRAREFFVEQDHPATGSYTFPGELVKLSATPMAVRRRSPLLDEHRAEVLIGELGFTEAELENLAPATADSGGC